MYGHKMSKLGWMATVPMTAVLFMVGTGVTPSVASAAVAKAHPQKASEPKGYTVAFATYDAPSGEQSTGTAVCPSGTVVWGGGSAIESPTDTSTLLADMNTSAPFGVSWVARVSNTSGSDLEFVVQAVCAKQPAQYTIKSKQADNAAGTQSYTKASCPKGTVLLGGGGSSGSDDLSVNMNSSFPFVSHKNIGSWVVNSNNGSGSDASVTAVAICATQPKGYEMQTSTVDDPPGGQGSTVTGCTAGEPIGGGALSNGGGLNVNIGSSFVYGGWGVIENNTSPSLYSVTDYSICAR
jgi:hypothetical protein